MWKRIAVLAVAGAMGITGCSTKSDTPPDDSSEQPAVAAKPKTLDSVDNSGIADMMPRAAQESKLQPVTTPPAEAVANAPPAEVTPPAATPPQALPPRTPVDPPQTAASPPAREPEKARDAEEFASGGDRRYRRRLRSGSDGRAPLPLLVSPAPATSPYYDTVPHQALGGAGGGQFGTAGEGMTEGPGGPAAGHGADGMPLPEFGSPYDAMAGAYDSYIPLDSFESPFDDFGSGFPSGGHSGEFDLTDDGLAGAFDDYNPPFGPPGGTPPFGPPGGFPPFGPPGLPDFPFGPPSGPDGGLTPTAPLPPPDF